MSEEVTLNGPDGLKKIGALIKDIHICMMTTAGPTAPSTAGRWRRSKPSSMERSGS